MVPDVRISQFSAGLREEASYREMETATVQAVRPVIREYEHQQTTGESCFKSRFSERRARKRKRLGK
jgi:hypothetical protein